MTTNITRQIANVRIRASGIFRKNWFCWVKYDSNLCSFPEINIVRLAKLWLTIITGHLAVCPVILFIISSIANSCSESAISIKRPRSNCCQDANATKTEIREIKQQISSGTLPNEIPHNIDSAVKRITGTFQINVWCVCRRFNKASYCK